MISLGKSNNKLKRKIKRYYFIDPILVGVSITFTILSLALVILIIFKYNGYNLTNIIFAILLFLVFLTISILFYNKHILIDYSSKTIYLRKKHQTIAFYMLTKVYLSKNESSVSLVFKDFDDNTYFINYFSCFKNRAIKKVNDLVELFNVTIVPPQKVKTKPKEVEERKNPYLFDF